LERYLERHTRGRLRRLEETLAPKEAIARFFAEIVAHSVGDRQRKGCFLVNSALEIAPHHAQCCAVIAKQFAGIEGFFARCILAAQADGTVPLHLDADDVAKLFLGVLLGVRVLARTNPSRDVLEGVVRPALALLDPRHRTPKRARQ
jgi:TetR/AcrR family transcriptional repressor of nem operon